MYGLNARPAMRFHGLPWIGRRMQLGVYGAKPFTGALLLTGGSRLRWGPIPLPIDLGPLGAPSCRILSSGELILPATVGSNGEAWQTISIPNDAGLRGLHFFNQWVLPFPGRNALGVIVSDGGWGTIG